MCRWLAAALFGGAGAKEHLVINSVVGKIEKEKVG